MSSVTGTEDGEAGFSLKELLYSHWHHLHFQRKIWVHSAYWSTFIYGFLYVLKMWLAIFCILILSEKSDFSNC